MTLQQIFDPKEEIYLNKVGSELRNKNMPNGAAYNPNEVAQDVYTSVVAAAGS